METIITLGSNDEIVRINLDSSGISYKKAYEFFRPKRNVKFRGRIPWPSYIFPSRSIFVWKLLHGKLETEVLLATKGRYSDGLYASFMQILY